MLTVTMALTLTSVGAATIDDGPAGIVDLMESPPRPGSCRASVATVIGLTTGYPTATFKVLNRTSNQTRDFLTINVVVDGQKRLFWTQLDLRPGSSATVNVEYWKKLDSRDLVLCGDRPGGIVDNPDPVATVEVVVDAESVDPM
jgi:hypothetical protein